MSNKDIIAARYDELSGNNKPSTSAPDATTAQAAAKKVQAQATNKGRGNTSYARNEALAAHQNLAAQNTLSYTDIANAAYWNSTKGRGHASTARNTYLSSTPAFRALETGLGKYGSTMEWYNNIKNERNKARTALFSLNDEKKSRDTLNRAKATWAAENWSRDEVEDDDLDERISAAERALQMVEEEYGYAKYYNDLEMDSAWEQNLLDQGISWGNAYTSTYQAQAGLQKQIDNVYAELQRAQRENKNAGVFGAGMREEASAARVAELEETYDRLLDQMEMVGRRNQYALDMMTKDAQAVERGQLLGDFLLEQDERTQQQGKAEFIDNYTKGNTMGDVWDALRSDRSDFMPTSAWSQEQMLKYQTLLGYGYEDRAREYAAQTNKSINDAKIEEAIAPKYEWGYGADAGFLGRAARAAAGTVATVATAPERLASYLNKVQDVYTTGVYTGEDRAQLHDYAEAIAGGRAQAMNDRHGTIDGKGWGDLYQAINSVAQSMVYGNALGKAGTLAIFFGQAADSGFDEAIARGATGEQAALSGLLSGAAEVIAEKMPLDNLLATDKAAARGLAKSILKQSGIEGAEEGITSLMNTFADKLVMGDRSALDQQIKELMAEGMSYEDARSKTMRDYANSVAWDVVIGAVSGAAGAGLQYGRDAIRPYTDRYGADAQTIVDEAKQVKEGATKAKAAQARLDKGKSISNATAKKLVTTVNRSRMVDAVEKQINTRSPETEQKTARSLANAIVAKSRSERLTDNQRKLIDKNTELVSELEKDMSDTKPADWVKTIGVRGAEAAVYGDRDVINARQQREEALLNSGEYSEAKAANIEDGQDVQEYSEDFDVVAEVFGNSNNFQSFDEVWNTIKADTILTEAQARNAWETGKARLAKMDMTPKLTRRGTGKLSFEAVSDGGVQYEAPSADETEAFKRSARYQYLAALSKKIGVDIVFFKGGAEGINGKYQDGTVYLAIDASPTKYDTVDGYVMLTAAHELTHYIREASPARYAELKDFVTKHLIEKGKLENGKTLTALIAAKRRAYADAGVELSVDAAVEEVVADACEMMLKDNDLVVQLNKERPSVYNNIRFFLKRFMAKVKAVFAGLEAHHAEAKGMMDSFNELQRIWNLGLSEAAENRKPRTVAEKRSALERKFAAFNRMVDEESQNPEALDYLNEEADALNAEEAEIRALELEEQRAQAGEVSVDYGRDANHIDNRTPGSVASRDVKAFQYDHPQLHEYFAAAARQLADEVQAAQMQDNVQRGKKGGATYHGPVAQLVDMGLTKPRALQCLEDIINDKGAENYADAKRVEIVLNDMLSNGWRDMSRRNHEANAEYIAAKEEVTGGRDSNSWDAYLEDHMLSLLDGLTTEEELRREWEAGRGKFSRKLDVDNFDAKSYPVVELSAQERNLLQSEAITWHADKVGQIIRQTLGAVCYTYYFDADYNPVVIDKSEAVNIHERRDIYDKLNRRKTDRTDDRLGSRGRIDTSHLLSTERRADAGSNRNDGRYIRRERESNRGRNAKDNDGLQVSQINYPTLKSLSEQIEWLKGQINNSGVSKETKTEYRRELKQLRDEMTRRMPKMSLKDSEAEAKTAEEYFGTTYRISEAGYLLTNGKLLDFSGRHEGASGGYRTVDHRDIADAFGDGYGDDSYSGGMLKFMQSGNIRLSPESGGINLSVKPTKSQLSTLDRYISSFRGEVILDIDDANGDTIASIEYPRRTYSKRIINDIVAYFDDGVIPLQPSELGQFRYSLKDEAYMSAVDAGDMETAQRMVDEAAEREGYDIKAYHGTPNGTFTVFRDWQYFTEDREYADIYQNQGASSNGYKATAQKPKTYSVFLKLSNVFDTRNPKEQRIFNDEFYRKWGNGAPLSERGLPDWTDGDDLIEFFEENGYNYDAVLIDEGGTGGYGDAVNDRGISIVVKESSQIKSADPVTYDDAGNVIPLSQRFNERQPDIRYSIKDEAQSDRMLLANTLMTAAQNDGERRRLNNYKAQIDVFADIQQQLADAEDELSRAYRAGDKQAIAKAQRERNALTEKLIRADKKLLELQATKPLKELMARVKQDTRRHTQSLARERGNKRELRNKIKTLHSQMTAQLLKPKENKYVPKPLLKTVAELLDEINLDSGRSEKIKAKLTELSGQYQAIAKSNEYGYAFDNEVAGMIAQLQSVIAEKDDTSIYHMSKAELEMVYNTMKAINHTVRESVKLIGVEENRDIFELAKAMMNETGKANPVASKLANKYINATLRPDVFFKRMGGYVKNSVWQFMGDMLNEAQRKQTQLQMEGAAIFEELMRDTDAFEKMTDPKNLIDIGLEDESGNPVLVTMDIALKIYMDTMAEDNARHFMSGGYTIPNMREYYKGKVSDAFSRGSVTIHGFGPMLADLEHQLRSAETEAEQAEIQQKIEQAEADAATWVESLRQNIYEQMGEYELEWVRAAEKFFNQFSQRVLNETTMAVYGFEKATVPYYVPIHTDSAYRQANFESISRDMSLENSGFMKQRVKASNPVLAEGIVDVINGQIDKVAKYAAMMPAIRNFQKVYGKSTTGFENSVQAAVRSKYGNEALKYIENIITDLTSPRRTEGGMLGEFADRLRGNLAQAALTVNPRVAIEQATSYPKAAVVVGYGPLLKAMRDIRSNPVKDQTAREEIAQWTPLMWYRMKGYFDRDIGDLRNDKQMLSKVNNKLKFITGWIEAVEGSTVGQMWYAAQYYVEDTTELERGTDEFLQETAEVFNRIVEQTQANYTMFQRPDILRNPNAIVKQLTMFMTERLQNANMVFDAVGTYNAYVKDYRNGENDVTEEDVQQAKQTVVRTTSSLMAATAASVAFKLAADALLYSMKGYRDDDEELTTESIVSQVIENFFESIAGNFLWGSELFSIMRSVITGETYYGISLGGVETFTDALNALVKTIQEPTWENWKKSIKTAMQMLGIPVNNGIKIYNAIAYRIKDAQEDNYWGDFASEVKLTDEQRNKQLYKAVISGDDKKVGRLFEYYGTEAEADAALAKHIKTMYQNDELNAEEAQAQLEDYASMSEYDAKLDIIKLTCKKETGIAYENLQQAFIDKQITEAQAVEYRAKYGLYDNSDAQKEVRQWACERETGYAYDDLPRYLASEDITKQQAIEYRMEYGGQSLEDATVTVTKWMGEIETGIPYNKVEDYFRDGLVDYDYLVDYYMKYWSYDELKAIQVADKRAFIGTDERLEEASLAAVSGYYGYCEEANVDKYVYLTAYQTCYDIRADKDEKGNSISGTALKKKLVYIDGLNLQPYQKTAVAKAIGITDKQLKKYKAPWI